MLAYWLLKNWLQVQRKRAPEPGSSCRCPQFEKESSRWLMNHVVLLLCCLPSTDVYIFFTFMVILTILCFVIQVCCSRCCIDDVNLSPSPAMALSVSLVWWYYDVFRCFPEHYNQFHLSITINGHQILLVLCTWQPDTSSLAGPFPSRSQDLGAKRHRQPFIYRE